MKITHIAVYVSDLEKSRAFYEKYFRAESSSRYHNPKTELQTYFLSFEGEVRLEFMQHPNHVSKVHSDTALGLTHLAFSVGFREAVEELTARIEGDGYKVVSAPRMTGDGYYESVILDCDGNLIEITE